MEMLINWGVYPVLSALTQLIFPTSTQETAAAVAGAVLTDEAPAGASELTSTSMSFNEEGHLLVTNAKLIKEILKPQRHCERYMHTDPSCLLLEALSELDQEVQVDDHMVTAWPEANATYRKVFRLLLNKVLKDADLMFPVAQDVVAEISCCAENNLAQDIERYLHKAIIGKMMGYTQNDEILRAPRDPTDPLAVWLTIVSNSPGGQLMLENGLTVKRAGYLVTNIVGAGEETTGSVLRAAIVECAINPDIQDNLHSEIEEAIEKGATLSEAIRDSKTLQHMLIEALRMAAPASQILRRVHSPFVLGSQSVDSGTVLQVGIRELSRDEAVVGEKPDTFIPSRKVVVDAPAFLPSLKWFPFGSGSNICPGSKAFIAMAKPFLGLLLYHNILSVSSDYNPYLTAQVDYARAIHFVKMQRR